jgi:hypothetical protein
MRLASIYPGDLVKVDKRGRRFYAEVTDTQTAILGIRPLARTDGSYGTAEAREVLEHYKRMGRPRKKAGA